jgi:pSer/pThr/pTyr-binding forkhead associated (FHA) protein
MLKCPFCGFDNEEGALFCEQCKSDLSAVPSSEPVVAEAVAVAVEEAVAVMPMAEPIPEAEPMAEATPIAEPVAESVAEPAPEPAPPAAEAPAPAPAPAAAPAAAAPSGRSVPEGSQPKLVVIRGQKVNAEFPIYPDLNFIGRADEKPVDIDLEDQEPPDRVWSSRQHAVIQFDDAQGNLTIEDLNSANGTFVNRNRIYPNQKKQLFVNDVIQIGNVQMRLKA